MAQRTSREVGWVQRTETFDPTGQFLLSETHRISTTDRPFKEVRYDEW
ncbi:MAG: hypothetical protein HC799_17135 [Limnothrix sp. RL_2_0]|nr:hypothetical protein [Limnothrix sp. RL_2_0]